MSVLVFGSLNLDLVTYADKLPAIGETIVGEKLLKFPGGKGLNQAIAARRAGSEVLMVGSIGNDADGDYLFDILKSENIDPKFITKTSEQTGIAVIEVSKSAENPLIIIAGANSKTRFSNKVLTSSPSVTVSLAQLETPIAEVAKFIHESKAAGKITMLNPAPIQKLDQQLLQDTDYLIANETEASFLIGSAVEHLSKDEAVTIARQLQKNGSKKVIITLGEQGSVYLDQEKELFTPAYKVKAVDTTAAGDAFCGAFATAISENKPVEYALKFASAAGGLAATKAGAVPSLPTQQEILSMFTSLD
jgi:ribokinase